jgi:hypothetical protein
MKVEYKVRPVTRFVVTRFYADSDPSGCGVGSSVCGEFDNADVAYEVGYALCKAEHERLGLPIASMDIIYPQHPLHSLNTSEPA